MRADVDKEGRGGSRFSVDVSFPGTGRAGTGERAGAEKKGWRDERGATDRGAVGGGNVDLRGGDAH